MITFDLATVLQMIGGLIVVIVIPLVILVFKLVRNQLRSDGEQLAKALEAERKARESGDRQLADTMKSLHTYIVREIGFIRGHLGLSPGRPAEPNQPEDLNG